VPVAAEVAAFERKIGGDEDFVAGWGGEDSAVVADAEAQAAGACGRGALPDGGDEGEFSGGGHESQNTLACALFG
jgi:hypothetical protein